VPCLTRGDLGVGEQYSFAIAYLEATFSRAFPFGMLSCCHHSFLVIDHLVTEVSWCCERFLSSFIEDEYRCYRHRFSHIPAPIIVHIRPSDPSRALYLLLPRPLFPSRVLILGNPAPSLPTPACPDVNVVI